MEIFPCFFIFPRNLHKSLSVRTTLKGKSESEAVLARRVQPAFHIICHGFLPESSQVKLDCATLQLHTGSRAKTTADIVR